MRFYTRFCDIFWKPISLLSGLLLELKWIQRSRFAPYVLGAAADRWPEPVTDVDDFDLSELSEEVRELILKRAGKR